ncbi:MAG: hypothetical protein MK240_01420 [Opitutales bacterium]|nr:hypothetical protein [Opitutales bacterium]
MHRFLSAALAMFALAQGSRAEFSDSLLRRLEGVGIQIRPLHNRSGKFFLTEGMLRERLARELNNLEIGLFSPDELEDFPGQPYLELEVNAAHGQGPSHFYTISMKLKEMTVLECPQDSEVFYVFKYMGKGIVGGG